MRGQVAVTDAGTEPAAVATRIRVLGDFTVSVGGHDVTPSAPKLREILAVLALHRDETVPVQALVDELWGSRPPRNAVAALHTHIYQLRRELAPAYPDGAVALVRTAHQGYLAAVRAEELDATVFGARLAAGAAALAGLDAGRAREHLAGALSLYRGQPLANVRCGDLLTRQVNLLREQHTRALELRIDADFQLGRHHELVGELRSMVDEQPYHEGFHEKLMLALHRCGRRNEALELYRLLRARLVDELGIEPGPVIQRLHRALITADPVLDTTPAGTVRRPPPVPAPPAVPAAPAQLPPDIPDFTARVEVLARARAALRTGAGPASPPILLLRGMAGVGKTTTALHLAHELRARYPDGQFFADLGGSRAVPEPAAEIAGAFLRGCGLPAAGVASAVERAAAFRTWAATRRALVVLDDADSAAQVQPLLPAGPGCAVVITGRVPLYGLPGLRTLELPVFDVDDAVSLLDRLVGDGRVAREPAAAVALVRAVGRLPLAIRLVGQRLAAYPGVRLDSYLDSIATAAASRPLSGFPGIGADLAARFDASYRPLPERDRRVFRLLAALGTTVFTATDAARLLLSGPVAAETALMRLADAHLVQVVPGDTGTPQRYTLHELMHRYSLECLGADAGDATRAA